MTEQTMKLLAVLAVTCFIATFIALVNECYTLAIVTGTSLFWLAATLLIVKEVK